MAPSRTPAARRVAADAEDFGEAGVVEGGLRRAVGHDPAAGEDDGAVRPTPRGVKIMQGGEDGAAGIRIGAQNLHGLMLVAEIERGGGFVHDEDGRRAGENPGKMHPRLFAA